MPRFIIEGNNPKRNIQLSYHGDYHYNSVHNLIPTQVDSTKIKSSHSVARIGMKDYSDAIEQVSLSVPWLPVAAAEWAVAHNKGNVDLAIEQLIALGDAAYHLSSDNVHHTSASTSHLPEVEPRSQSSASETVLTSQPSKPEGRSSSSSSNGAGTVSATAKTALMSKKVSY